jgi:hypothetical protein
VKCGEDGVTDFIGQKRGVRQGFIKRTSKAGKHYLQEIYMLDILTLFFCTFWWVLENQTFYTRKLNIQELLI